MDSIGIEATSAFSGDVHGLSYPTLFGMLLLVFILGVISSRRLFSRELIVRNLFLKITIRRQGQDCHSYVRSLSATSIDMVMSEEPKTGEEIELELSSLPDFSGTAKTAKALITKVKLVSNHQNNYIVHANFIPSESVSESVKAYLNQLLA
jgi:hypothetical protein